VIKFVNLPLYERELVGDLVGDRMNYQSYNINLTNPVRN